MHQFGLTHQVSQLICQCNPLKASFYFKVISSQWRLRRKRWQRSRWQKKRNWRQNWRPRHPFYSYLKYPQCLMPSMIWLPNTPPLVPMPPSSFNAFMWPSLSGSTTRIRKECRFGITFYCDNSWLSGMPSSSWVTAERIWSITSTCICSQRLCSHSIHLSVQQPCGAIAWANSKMLYPKGYVMLKSLHWVMLARMNSLYGHQLGCCCWCGHSLPRSMVHSCNSNPFFDWANPGADSNQDSIQRYHGIVLHRAHVRVYQGCKAYSSRSNCSLGQCLQGFLQVMLIQCLWIAPC